jgi:SAM-dependent methyltransferase
MPTSTRACQVCGDVALRYRHDWLFQCDACGVLSADFPVAIPAEASSSGIDEAAREAGLVELRRRNNRKLLGGLKALTPPGARLLDVGSGPGFLLTLAGETGFEGQGIEPDANVVEVARRQGSPVRHGYFPDQLHAAEVFDVIVFNDVLEHIPDLRGALAASFRHLAPGGVLCLNCPDKRGLFFGAAAVLDRIGIAGPYDRLWQRGLPSPHVWYFTPGQLQHAAAAEGFEPAGAVRLETIELGGLWSRIRSVKDTSMLVSLASFAFAVAVYPLSRLVPSDATAVFLRRPG